MDILKVNEIEVGDVLILYVKERKSEEDIFDFENKIISEEYYEVMRIYDTKWGKKAKLRDLSKHYSVTVSIHNFIRDNDVYKIMLNEEEMIYLLGNY